MRYIPVPIGSSQRQKRPPVTVCIAAIFQWNYGPLANPDYKPSALVITDRMITAGDVQYEPHQTKVGEITRHVLIVIAGDYSLHSQAIRTTMRRFHNEQTALPETIARFYGKQIQTIKLREAEDLFLAPLGLNADTFLAQQKEMPQHLVSRLTEQMQSYRGEEVEALVIGTSAGYAQIYGVDTKGIVSCYDDVGFAAIGIGAWHAKSRLMQAGYTGQLPFSRAAVLTYAAKKVAELAPGVGTNTDLTFVFTTGCERMPDEMSAKLHSLYLEHLPRVSAVGMQFIDDFQAYVSGPKLQVADESQKALPGANAQANESASPAAAETPRPDEGRPSGQIVG